MNYLVVVSEELKNHQWKKCYFEFMAEEEAVKKADREVARLKERGCEYSVLIYELTNL